MHDFMHDLAQEVAGVKCKVAKNNERDFDEKILHLSLSYQLTSSSREIPNSMLNMKLLRTFLLPEQIISHDGSPFSKSISKQLFTRLSCLRVLDLNRLRLMSLPSSIGKLVHLRYLNLSRSRIEKLPDSITDLWNLQTLILSDSRKLTALPRDMRKLINLRSLDVRECYKLTDMPSGLGGLTSLNKLPRFIVNPCASKPTAKLSDLKNLNHLRGDLEIDIKCNSKNCMSEAAEAYLILKHGLTELAIGFPNGSDLEIVDCNHDEVVLEDLKPPSNIRILNIQRYKGQKLPSWATMDKLCITLPNLVEVTLWDCQWCQELPNFSQLCFLKRLDLNDLKSVEYIESGVWGVHSSRFFPSLEELELWGMENLKGWWKEVEASGGEEDTESASCEEVVQQFPRLMEFSKLSTLVIFNCPKLRMMPLSPNLVYLTLENSNENLSVKKLAPSIYLRGPKLKKLMIGKDGVLNNIIAPY